MRPNLELLTEKDYQTLSAALIYCDKHHPNYKGDWNRVWFKLFQKPTELSLFDVGGDQTGNARHSQ